MDKYTLDAEKIAKMFIVGRGMVGAINELTDYLEEPPESIAEAITFLKRSHNFFMSAAVFAHGSETGIKHIPQEVIKLWDDIEVKIDEDSINDLREVIDEVIKNSADAEAGSKRKKKKQDENPEQE